MKTKLFLLTVLLIGLDQAYAQNRIIQFVYKTIDTNPPGRPWYKMTGDMDGDGDVDIIVGGAKGPLVWYANPNWQKRKIAEGGWDGVRGQTTDIDKDGDIDIVMGGIVWFENPGKKSQKWKKHRVDNQKAHDVEIADINGDGRLDMIARDQSAFGKNGNHIYIYYQSSNDKWRRQVIDCPHGEGFKAADIDTDSDVDIVIGGIWFENPGNAQSKWSPHRYTTEWTEPDAKVELADLNGDDRADIILTPAELQGQTYKVCWYQAPVNRKTENWKEHVVIESIECVIHSLGVGDIDGDGDMDLAMAEMHQGRDPDEVFIMFNDRHGSVWHKQILSDRGSHDILVVDIDGDGDHDIVGANHAGVHPLEIWSNQSNPKSFKPRTKVTIANGRWHINDTITYRDTQAEGLLMNVRMVNSVFEDTSRPDFNAEENTNKFLARIPEYTEHGVRGFTINLQGGFPGYEGAVNSAFSPDGSLRKIYMQRVRRVIEECDRHGIAVILGCYYQRQDQILTDEEAVKRGIVNAVRWLSESGYTNVVLEIANEFNHPGFDHQILKKPEGQVKLIKLAQSVSPGLLVSTSGLGDGRLPDNVAQASDFLLIHFNGTSLDNIPGRINALKKFGKSIVCNEDDKHGNAAARAAQLSVEHGCSWGFMHNDINQYVPFEFNGTRDDPAVYTKLKQLTSPSSN